MNYIRAAIMGGFSALVLLPGAAFADTGSISNTGANSSNSNTSTVTNSQTVVVNDNSSSTSNFTINANTGGNTVVGNTTVADSGSGDIAINLKQADLAPATSSLSSTSATTSSTVSQSGNGSISNTGANSTNSNNFSLSNTSSTFVTTSRNVTNNVNVAANTGNNTVAQNTQVTGGSSGNISINIGVTNDFTGKGGDLTPPPVTTTGGDTSTDQQFLGRGGDFLPLPTFTLTSADTSPLGVGGGYFPSGNEAFPVQTLAFFTIALLLVFFPPFARKFQNSMLAHILKIRTEEETDETL